MKCNTCGQTIDRETRVREIWLDFYTKLFEVDHNRSKYDFRQSLDVFIDKGMEKLKELDEAKMQEEARQKMDALETRLAILEEFYRDVNKANNAYGGYYLQFSSAISEAFRNCEERLKKLKDRDVIYVRSKLHDDYLSWLDGLK
jgi:hypothetical protein